MQFYTPLMNNKHVSGIAMNLNCPWAECWDQESGFVVWSIEVFCLLSPISIYTNTLAMIRERQCHANGSRSHIRSIHAWEYHRENFIVLLWLDLDFYAYLMQNFGTNTVVIAQSRLEPIG